MISGLLNKLSKWTARNKMAGPRTPGQPPIVVPRKAHTISRRDISECALKVLYRLHKHGYEAYLVGGAVRDLLLGVKPKDFDIATNATPEQVAALFRNCRLIGRRFRLAHVFFGDEIIEVATFRGGEAAPTPERQQAHSAEGMILRDNVYGTVVQDAWRRDFTVNALYYNIADFSLVDYTGGLADLKQQRLSLIGEPEQRFREDPVRMLRVIRFASKLGLKIDPALLAPLTTYRPLIDHVAPARLFEEVLKMFHSGHGEQAYTLTKKFGFWDHLFPVLAHEGAYSKHTHDFLSSVLRSTDTRVQADRPVTPAFLFAAICWYPICHYADPLIADGMPMRVARERAIGAIFDQQTKRVSIPRRLMQAVREILTLQMRMEGRPSKRLERLVYEPRFRAAYDFLALRAKAGEPLEKQVTWWQKFYEADTASRKKQGGRHHAHRRRKPRKRQDS